MLRKLKDKKKDKSDDKPDTEIKVTTKILGFGTSEDDEVYLRYGNAEKPATNGQNLVLDTDPDEITRAENPYGAVSEPSADLSGYYGNYGNSEPPLDTGATKPEAHEISPLNHNLSQSVGRSDNGINENELRSIFNRLFNRTEHDENLFISAIQISYVVPSLSDSILAPLESIINSDRLRSLKTIRFLYELLKKQKLMEVNESRIVFILLSVIRKMQLIELKDIVEEELLNEDSSIRSLSISIFGEWREKEILQNFDNFLLDPNPQIKIAAINALKHYKDANYAAKILNIIESERFDVLISAIQYFIETGNRALVEKVPYLINELKNELLINVNVDLFLFYKELMKYIRIYRIECDYFTLLEVYLLFLEHNLDSEEIFRAFVYLQQKNLPIKEIVLEFIKMPRWAKLKWKLEELVRMMGL